MITCNSCGHQAEDADMIRELTPSWEWTGAHVCRDADACFLRWAATIGLRPDTMRRLLAGEA